MGVEFTSVSSNVGPFLQFSTSDSSDLESAIGRENDSFIPSYAEALLIAKSDEHSKEDVGVCSTEYSGLNSSSTTLSYGAVYSGSREVTSTLNEPEGVCALLPSNTSSVNVPQTIHSALDNESRGYPAAGTGNPQIKQHLNKLNITPFCHFIDKIMRSPNHSAQESVEQRTPTDADSSRSINNYSLAGSTESTSCNVASILIYSPDGNVVTAAPCRVADILCNVHLIANRSSNPLSPVAGRTNENVTLQSERLPIIFTGTLPSNGIVTEHFESEAPNAVFSSTREEGVDIFPTTLSTNYNLVASPLSVLQESSLVSSENQDGGLPQEAGSGRIQATSTVIRPVVCSDQEDSDIEGGFDGDESPPTYEDALTMRLCSVSVEPGISRTAVAEATGAFDEDDNPIIFDSVDGASETTDVYFMLAASCYASEFPASTRHTSSLAALHASNERRASNVSELSLAHTHGGTSSSGTRRSSIVSDMTLSPRHYAEESGEGRRAGQTVILQMMETSL